MLNDVSDMLKPSERDAAEAWKTKHSAKCPEADYIIISNVSAFGYRLKVLCQRCRAKEDVTGPARDPAPKH
jgi:hypothetical protein